MWNLKETLRENVGEDKETGRLCHAYSQPSQHLTVTRRVHRACPSPRSRPRCLWQRIPSKSISAYDIQVTDTPHNSFYTPTPLGRPAKLARDKSTYLPVHSMHVSRAAPIASAFKHASQTTPVYKPYWSIRRACITAT